MVFSILTYNTLFNKAFVDLKSIIEKYHPDIICLQEVDTNEKNLKKLGAHGYQIAEYVNSFIKFGQIFGVATFFNPQSFSFLESKSFNLSRSISEILFMLSRILHGTSNPKAILKTNFVYAPSKKLLTVYNVHLPVGTTNAVRLKQIKQAFEEIKNNHDMPLIIAGDFNYWPYGRKNLEKLAAKYGLSEATANINYTIRYSTSGKTNYSFVQRLAVRIFKKFFTDRLKIDYIFYRNLKPKETKRINIHLSDHYPILATFEI